MVVSVTDQERPCHNGNSEKRLGTICCQQHILPAKQRASIQPNDSVRSKCKHGFRTIGNRDQPIVGGRLERGAKGKLERCIERGGL
jgi:hypothetical protein